MNLPSDVLTLLKGHFPDYEFRKTQSRGDFSGREHAIDVFGVPLAKQIQFLRDARDIRGEMRLLFGHSGQFIFRAGVSLSKGTED